jgi:hypothetical protein
MIEQSKYKNALMAVHAVVIHAKQISYEQENHKEIGELLDIAEYLVTLIMTEEDRTACFRQQLGLIAQQFSYYLPVQKFEEEIDGKGI